MVAATGGLGSGEGGAEGGLGRGWVAVEKVLAGNRSRSVRQGYG